MVTLQDQTNQAEPQILAEHLREHADRYFNDMARSQVNVQCVSKQKRLASILYRFEMSTSARQRSLLVKVPSPWGADQFRSGRQRTTRRPRLVARTDPEVKVWLEYSALSAIHEHFRSLGDPRFGTIRTLDFLPQHRAIVMELVQGKNLSWLLTRTNPLHHEFLSRDDLQIAFCNTGAWLRAFHALPNGNSVHSRNVNKAAIIRSVKQFGEFLANTIGSASFFEMVESKVEAAARRILPDALPLGLIHGDYAMRNILIGSDYQVTVLDTLAKSKAPIYEDIAYFLTCLQTSRPQVYSQGLAFSKSHLARYEEAFLEGYFGQEAIPIRAIRLYEVQAILDKWASTVERLRMSPLAARPGSSVWGRFLGRIQQALFEPFFRKTINSLLRTT